MTPAEQQDLLIAFGEMMDRKLDAALKPVVARIKTLEVAGASKADVSNVEHKVGSTAAAIGVRDRAIVDAIDGVKTAFGERLTALEAQAIKPARLAAQGAQTAAVAAKDATTAIAVEQVQAKAAQHSTRIEGRWRSFAGFVALVIVALLNHFGKG